MNAAADKISETLRQHKYLTDKELLSIFSLRDIGFCDQDVCCRILFPKRVKLDTIYYLKENERQVLLLYVRDSIGGAGGSASLALQSGDSPPPPF